MMISPLRSLLFLITLLISFPTVAQQVPYYSAIRENWGLLNPAFLDFHYYDYVKAKRPNSFISISSRHQTVSQSQAITQVAPRFDFFIDRIKLGAGINFDKIGIFQEGNGYIQFAYNVIQKKKDQHLFFAFSPKLRFQSIGLEAEDFADFGNDPIAQNVVGLNSRLFDLSVGVSYDKKINKNDILLLGLGTNQTLTSNIDNLLTNKKIIQLNAFVGLLCVSEMNGRKGIHHQIEPILLIKTTPRTNFFWFRNNKNPIVSSAELSIRYSRLRDPAENKGKTRYDWRIGCGLTTAGLFNFEFGLLPDKKSSYGLNMSIPFVNNSLGAGLEFMAAYRFWR